MPKGKKMYSPELKYEIVQKYLDGKGGVRALAAEYHVDKSFNFAHQYSVSKNSHRHNLRYPQNAYGCIDLVY